MHVAAPGRVPAIAIAGLQNFTQRAAAQNLTIKPGEDVRTNRIVLARHDITALDSDVIVCPGNRKLEKGIGISELIFNAAGKELEAACHKFAPCEIGQVKRSAGYKLRCKIIYHTVGPRVSWFKTPTMQQKTDLEKCYKTALETAVNDKFATIAFPDVLSEEEKFPLRENAEIACRVAYEFFWHRSQ